MTFDGCAFTHLEPLKMQVEILVGNNRFITAEGKREIPLKTPQGNILLTDVLLVPELSSNLISYTRLLQKGCTIISSAEEVRIFEGDGSLFMTAEQKGGKLRVNAKQMRHQNMNVATEGRRKHIGYPGSNPNSRKHSWDHAGMEYALAIQARECNYTRKASPHTWHPCLGHVNKAYSKRTATVACVDESTAEEGKAPALDCTNGVCLKTKQQHFRAIPKDMQKSQRPLQLVHLDIAFAMPETIHGKKYFLVSVNDYTGYTWASPLTSRASEEMFPILQTWLNKVPRPPDNLSDLVPTSDQP